MDEKMILLLALMGGSYFLLRWLFPDGSLGWLHFGRDDFGKWHFWWNRP